MPFRNFRKITPCLHSKSWSSRCPEILFNVKHRFDASKFTTIKITLDQPSKTDYRIHVSVLQVYDQEINNAARHTLTRPRQQHDDIRTSLQPTLQQQNALVTYHHPLDPSCHCPRWDCSILVVVAATSLEVELEYACEKSRTREERICR